MSSLPATLGAADAWRERALAAERRVEQAQADARASLAPYLAQVLKEALVQELAVQRKDLLQAQQIAATEIAQLTQHLDEVRAPIQERLRSYEARIQELEQELAARTEENRELLKLKIEMMRRQIESRTPAAGWDSTEVTQLFLPAYFSPACAGPARNSATLRRNATGG